MNLTETQRLALHERACAQLEPQGWMPMGWMLFFYSGRIYDLSAADLGQVDRIVREGLFVVGE
jgi:hypothetical protein